MGGGRTRTATAVAIWGVLAGVVLVSVSSTGATEINVQSDTIIRSFERDTDEGKNEDVFPIYEYLSVDIGKLDRWGPSLHAYGWGRNDFADSGFFEDNPKGELLYAYLQYDLPVRNFKARLGRQYVFEGVSNESVDGLWVSTDVTSYLGVSVWGGSPVSLEDEDGRSGDAIYGGTVSLRQFPFYDVSLSYKYKRSDGNRDEENVGIDVNLQFPWNISVSGHSVRSLVTDGWGDHSYQISINPLPVKFSFILNHYDYEHLFNLGDNSYRIFRSLSTTGNDITVVGGKTFWYPIKNLELGLTFKNFDYDERLDEARFYSALATWIGPKMPQIGAEVGWMDGELDRNSYTMWRAFVYGEIARIIVSGDVIVEKYVESINGEDTSVFGSLGVGRRFFRESLELRLSGDLSSNTEFDYDWRSMAVVRYFFDK